MLVRHRVTHRESTAEQVDERPQLQPPLTQRASALPVGQFLGVPPRRRSCGCRSDGRNPLPRPPPASARRSTTSRSPAYGFRRPRAPQASTPAALPPGPTHGRCATADPGRLCGPDSHRLAALSLPLGYPINHPSGPEPELLDALSAGCRNTNGVVALRVPRDVIKAKCAPYLARGQPARPRDRHRRENRSCLPRSRRMSPAWPSGSRQNWRAGGGRDSGSPSPAAMSAVI